MDFHLKQWGGQLHQHQSEASGTNFQHQKSSYAVSTASANAAKIPKLLFEPSSSFYPHQSSSFPNSPASAAGSATTTLPLFVPEEGKEEGRGQEQEQGQVLGQGGNAHPFTKLQSSTFPSSDHHHSKPPRNSNYNSNSMGSYFSWAQWQELELQALIYRYMIAGATVPPELLMPIKKSLLVHSSPYFHHNHFSASQYPPPAALLHSGYWGRAAMDPEPGRCRRTDGKKWRCSRDVVVGQKYCERHMHRGRNRSRKPVEIPTTAGAAASAGDIFKTADSISMSAAASVSGVASGGGSHFSLSVPSHSSSIDVFHPTQSYSSEVKTENRGGRLFTVNNPADASKPDGHVLRHFFDDWPRSLQDSENAGGTDNLSTCLSISDVSLKLSTGNGDEPIRNPDRDHHPPMSTWASGWGSNHVAHMGGPLAEALRSSSNTAHSSPTSVLHHLARGSTSEASFIST